MLRLESYRSLPWKKEVKPILWASLILVLFLALLWLAGSTTKSFLASSLPPIASKPPSYSSQILPYLSLLDTSEDGLLYLEFLSLATSQDNQEKSFPYVVVGKVLSLDRVEQLRGFNVVVLAGEQGIFIGSVPYEEIILVSETQNEGVKSYQIKGEDLGRVLSPEKRVLLKPKFQLNNEEERANTGFPIIEEVILLE